MKYSCSEVATSSGKSGKLEKVSKIKIIKERLRNDKIKEKSVKIRVFEKSQKN